MEKWEKGTIKEGKLKKCIIVCPAMNTYMWDHPITEVQVDILKSWGYEVVGPIAKKMMCGDIGNGAMAEVKDIVSFVMSKYKIAIG
jgi:phosphopantothenoylcysteine decarboxylase